MKIIFLDIDGVLNSEEWSLGGDIAPRGYGGHFKENSVITTEDVGWDPDCVDRLRRIVTATDAKIVISSTWRIYFTIKKFQEMFALYGWPDAPIIDRTLDLGGRKGMFYETNVRGLEVNEWLNRSPWVTKYIIIDDIEQFLPDQEVHCLFTNPDVGLDDLDADMAIDMLNKPERI